MMKLEKILNGGKKLVARTALGVMTLILPVYGCEDIDCPNCSKPAELLTGQYEGELVFYDFSPEEIWNVPKNENGDMVKKEIGNFDVMSLDPQNRYIRLLIPDVRDYELDSDGCFADSWTSQEGITQSADIQVSGCFDLSGSAPELSLTAKLELWNLFNGEYGYTYDFEGVKTKDLPVY